jgi:protein SCO1/2
MAAALGGSLALATPGSALADASTAAPFSAQQVIKQVGIDQKLDGQIPLDLEFRDENGKTVKLGDYFGDKPVILALVYYECPMVCTMTLNGMLAAMKPMSFDAGKEFNIVTISFDPREGPDLAKPKKENYLRQYNRPGAEAGWHFLTGDQKSIDALTDAVGFRYAWDEASQQFAHASGIMVATPKGKLSRYFYGLEYSTNDIRLSLMEAAEERIGTLADQLVLLCYAYDPMSGKYGFRIMLALRVGAVLTMGAIGTFLFVSLRRERRMRRAAMSMENERSSS